MGKEKGGMQKLAKGEAPPGGRMVDRIPVQGHRQPWPDHTVRYISRRWTGPVHISAQGIVFNIRYVGVHEHVGHGAYPLHHHPHAELMYTLSGHGAVRVPGRRSEELCEPGTLLVMPPGRMHQSSWAIPHGKAWRMMIVDFDIVVDMGQVIVQSGETADLAFTPFYEWFFVREGTGLRLNPDRQRPVTAILEEIARSLNQRSYGICTDIVAGLLRVVSLFSQHIRMAGLADGRHVTPPVISKEAALLKARSLMEHGGVVDAGCVARVARTIGMSESHFIREFKRAYGTTPKQYSLDVLMRRAAALMARTDITVKDAAHSLGYEDPSSFSRAFTRYHGLSPTEYQKQYGQGAASISGGQSATP